MELSQCLGPHEWTYAIYPHTGNWRTGVYQQAEILNLPLEAAQVGPHPGSLPKSMSFLEVKGGRLQLAAFKRAEDRKTSYVVRLFNPESKTVNGTLKLWKPIKQAWLTNLDEKRQKELEPQGSKINFEAPKKKIITIEFVL
jgi:alpha-mannosidase